MLLSQLSRGPKAVIPVRDLNAAFQPEKIGHRHGLQISYEKEEHTRNLFVYHESGQVRGTPPSGHLALRFSVTKMQYLKINISFLILCEICTVHWIGLVGHSGVNGVNDLWILILYGKIVPNIGCMDHSAVYLCLSGDCKLVQCNPGGPLCLSEGDPLSIQ